jgi:hypothetical protein
MEGFEPPTCCLQGSYSGHLSYKGIVEIKGFEPLTPWSQTRYATNCATSRFYCATGRTRTYEAETADLQSAAIAAMRRWRVPVRIIRRERFDYICVGLLAGKSSASPISKLSSKRGLPDISIQVAIDSAPGLVRLSSSSLFFVTGNFPKCLIP